MKGEDRTLDYLCCGVKTDRVHLPITKEAEGAEVVRDIPPPPPPPTHTHPK